MAGITSRIRKGTYPLPLDVALLLRLCGWLFALMGLAAMLFLAPRTLYADPWRFVARLIRTPWPANVLAADNGHREVLPNLVRLAELEFMGGGQWLQIVVGVLLALSTFWLMCRLVATDRLAPAVRAAAFLVVAASIFWLGNQSGLAHGNESVHLYLVTLFLVAGVTFLLRGGDGRILLAVACGVLASFSFGAGVAVFAGYAAILFLRRACWRHWVLLGLGPVLVLAANGLAWDGGERMPALALSPLVQLDLLLRWLASPFIYAAWPVLDPDIASRVPVLAGALAPLAAAYQSVFGPVMVSRWPHALVGLVGLVLLARLTWLAWRRGGVVGSSEALGLAMAWFGLAVGGLIVLARMDYFLVAPAQLAASRYVPWSSLFWAGLALAALGRPSLRFPRRAASIALVGACLILPSTAWTGMLARRASGVAERVAAAAAANVVDPDEEMGENVPSEVAEAIPALRASRAEMFSWPEVRWLEDGRIPGAADITRLPGDPAPVIEPVRNLLGQPAWRVEFEMKGLGKERLVLACGDRPVGFAIRAGGGTGNSWVGWTSAPVDAACLAVARTQ